MTAVKSFADTFKPSMIRVYEPRKVVAIRNPSDECGIRSVIRESSGNASLSFGRYVTRAGMDRRFARIMAVKG